MLRPRCCPGYRTARAFDTSMGLANTSGGHDDGGVPCGTHLFLSCSNRHQTAPAFSKLFVTLAGLLGSVPPTLSFTYIARAFTVFTFFDSRALSCSPIFLCSCGDMPPDLSAVCSPCSNDLRMSVSLCEFAAGEAVRACPFKSF